ncbi:MAG: hypothetical protein GY820_46780 [Gammaproteobacteria bacterium]|nr:hypothetical protein [Gammaproteobacteria bacterium]
MLGREEGFEVGERVAEFERGGDWGWSVGLDQVAVRHPGLGPVQGVPIEPRKRHHQTRDGEKHRDPTLILGAYSRRPTDARAYTFAGSYRNDPNNNFQVNDGQTETTKAFNCHVSRQSLNEQATGKTTCVFS